jgi:hypothetical protein
MVFSIVLRRLLRLTIEQYSRLQLQPFLHASQGPALRHGARRGRRALHHLDDDLGAGVGDVEDGFEAGGVPGRDRWHERFAVGEMKFAKPL